jgi:hypothetical protein
MRARYSPMIPSVSICAPEKIAISEARNAKPGTVPPTDCVADEDDREDDEAEERERDPDEAREAERPRAEARQDVEGVRRESRPRVARLALRARVVARPEPSCSAARPS